MCGIYGSTVRYSYETVKAKMDLISFRGPDYSGIQMFDDVILGHNRLSIIDLDDRSNQPFSYHHLWIVFNGEIYNYQDLRKDLILKGYDFRTSSDTEVICAAYLEYGEACLDKFNGMFAFTIYDTRKNYLFGARDRFGKKPFYYCQNLKGFEFASQPSQINYGNSHVLQVDQNAVQDYLIWGYIPEPGSIWAGVKKLPAGYCFSYDLSSEKLDTRPYWDLDYSWDRRFTGDYREAKRELDYLITDAVRIRLNADVPLGVFLSGGIDSSLVAAKANSMVSGVKTFSIKFNEKGFDESEYALKVAAHLGTEHHTIPCDYNQGIDLINNFTSFYDEPFADSSAIPSMLLSKHTRQHVTVALSGDGGDEGYLGYSRYKWTKNVSALFKMPVTARRTLASLLRISPNYVHKLIAMGISIQDLETLYVRMMGGMENSWVLHPDQGLKTPFMHVLLNPKKKLLENLSDFDIKTYLTDDINTKVDRASMAFSLESRSPLMDYRVVEFGRNLPTSFKYNNGVQKRILKDILYTHVPASLFNRPKAGFTVPFKDWFRKELRDYVKDTLSESELRNIPGINVKRTMEMIDEHLTSKWNRYPQIWKLLVLSQWLKKNSPKTVSQSIVVA